MSLNISEKKAVVKGVNQVAWQNAPWLILISQIAMTD